MQAAPEVCPMKTSKEAVKEVVKEEVKVEKKEKSPYINKAIYENYFKGMKEKNQKRVRQGLEAIPVRTFEQWSN